MEDKRPDPSVVSEKLVKYKNNRDLAARKLDESNEEYIKTCSGTRPDEVDRKGKGMRQGR